MAVGNIYDNLMDAVLKKGYRQATYYASPTKVVKATYHGKREVNSKQHIVVVTTGKPNVREKQIIAIAQRSKDKFPLKQIFVKREKNK